MNILIFSWRGPKHPHLGGAEIVTHEHAKYWVKMGNKVTLFTSSFSGAKKEEIIDGVKVIRDGGEILGVQIRAWKWYWKSRLEDFDLIIDQFHGIPFFTPVFTEKKKLAFIHEVTREIWFLNHLPFFSRYFLAICGFFVEPWIFKLFYKNVPFMTVSNSTKKDLMSWQIPEKNIFVINNGVKIEKVGAQIKKEKEPTIIFLGSLSRDKGIEKALEIFAKVSSQIANAKLWVAGKASREYLEVLKNKSKNLGIEKNVRFLGFVSDKRKFELLSRVHLLLNPSVREGWGLVILEAASVGTPAVAFDVPGLRDSIQNGRTGILCQNKNLDQISKEIEKLLKDQKLLNDLSRNALSWSKKFKWENSTKNSLQLLRRVAKGD